MPLICLANKQWADCWWQVTGAESLCPEFAQNELFVGGDVGRDSMHMIHNHAMLPGLRIST